MSQPRRDELYLADIAEAAKRAISYTAELSYEQFLDNTQVQDAVLRNLQVIGEASKKVSASLRKAYPNLPWREMAGIRDRVVHDYFGVDYRVVWEVVQRDLPRLLSLIQVILDQENGSL